MTDSLVLELLRAARAQARSIRYQITIAKLPLVKDVDDFRFDNTAIDETLVRDLASGNFLAHQRNVVLVGGTGTGKFPVRSGAPLSSTSRRGSITRRSPP